MLLVCNPALLNAPVGIVIFGSLLRSGFNVLYCARHDFGTYVLSKTGNLKAVMDTMGHADVKTAMAYQHPELEIVRAAINSRHILRHTVEH